jgi:GDP-mannose 6-dehydrogenase
MNIAVFGLGYVGVVSAACLAQRGHRVVGVDVNELKVDLVNQGRSPIIEEDIDDLVRAAHAGGRLRATTDWRDAVASTDMAWLCVSTPSQANGNIDRQYLCTVSEQIGAAIRERGSRYSVVVRSTTLPGTTREMLLPILERESGKRAGDGFGVCYHPEFLREGTAVKDFYAPPKIVIGATDPAAEEHLVALYADYDAPLVRTTIEVAEMVKYGDNVWHALKVGFANEIGAIAKQLGIDGRAVMEVFCRDTKLNLSEKYLTPGFAFGGSCLPKDVRALTYEGRRMDLELPIISSVLPSNQRHIDRAFNLIADRGHRRVGMLGLSFKAGTDDLRESPFVELAERLIGKGYELCIYDPYVKPSMVTGANREYIQAKIPHISRLMVDTAEELVGWAETVVVGHREAAYARLLDERRNGGGVPTVVDLIGLARGAAGEPQREESGAGARHDPNAESGYHGICW